jgi:hypothetical protein
MRPGANLPIGQRVARRQALREPSRVGSDAAWLRAVVDPDNQDAHPVVATPGGDQPRLSARGAVAVAADAEFFAGFVPAFAAASAPYAP